MKQLQECADANATECSTDSEAASRLAADVLLPRSKFDAEELSTV